jgi:hypothetical protein
MRFVKAKPWQMAQRFSLMSQPPVDEGSNRTMESKRTEITIRISRLLVMNKVKAMTAWCEECGKQSHWLTVDDTALLLGITSRMVFRQAEAGALHSTETREGLLMVCLGSLSQEADSPDVQVRQIEGDSD